MRFKDFLNEGYSNYKNLLQRVMEKVDKKIDKIYPKGSFTILLDPDKSKEENSIITIKIGPNLESAMKHTTTNGNRSYLITIDSELNSKDEVYKTIAHEVTHISQHQSDFAHHDITKDIKNFKQLNNKKLKFKDYYSEVSHSQRETEKEAKLIGIFELLKRGLIKVTVDSLQWENEYYTFDFDTFIKKAFSYGIKKSNIDEFRKKVKENIEQWFEDIKKYERDIGGVFSIFKEKLNLIHMLNLNEKYYIQKISDYFKNITPEKRKEDWTTNWDVIDRNLKILNNEVKDHIGIPKWMQEYTSRALKEYSKNHPDAKKETLQLINKELQYRKQFGEE